MQIETVIKYHVLTARWTFLISLFSEGIKKGHFHALLVAM